MPLTAARFVALLALASTLACAREAPPEDFPGMRLLARVEARLEQEKAALKPLLAHYGLVFPVEPADLNAFMRQVRFHGEGPDLVLGTDYGPESHGGGLLRLLFDYWRPDARTPRLDDQYWFEANRRDLALGRIYAAGREQIFLPVPGRAAEETGAELPRSPQLPRMLFRFSLPGGPARLVEADAYKFVSLLIELEPARTRSWLNRTAQPLSLDLLMRHVREHYLASGASAAEPPDHSNLHLVELLAAFGSDLGPVQQHFLTVELAQAAFDAEDERYLLAHYAESLGQLLGVPGLRWHDDGKLRVRSWLEELERSRFRDVAGHANELEALCHLAKGLRSVRTHRAKLE
ncbi:MAG: hypothetical protein ACREI8_14740 [Myxococcota bacterium]